MGTDIHSLIGPQPAISRRLPVWIFWIVPVSLLPIAALSGGMKLWVLCLAVGLMVLVWYCPQEACGAGLLFLFASGILLPYAARFGDTVASTEMYYWAAGLLAITAAAVARIGWRSVFDVPRPAKAFLLVAAAATLCGLIHGASLSYALRQFYGVLLLIVYLGIGLHSGNEEILLPRIRGFGIACVACFLVYYIAIFPERGFHKEMSFSGPQASLLAIVLFIPGVQRRSRSWYGAATALLLIPVLLFTRGSILTFIAAIPAALAVRSKTWKARLTSWVLLGLIALPGLYPPAAQAVGEQLAQAPVIGNLIPSAAQDAVTLFERGVQAEVALNTVQTHPWLGMGLGSSFQWDSPSLGFLEGSYVDSGWGYLFQKMGLLGAATFVWLLIAIFTGVSRSSLGLSTCLISVSVVTMFSEPVFFHFTTAPFLGTFAGLLLAKKRQSGDSEAPLS